jgi:glutathione S-transferase
MYLRAAKIPYEPRFTNNLNSAPKGKLPYITDGDHKLGDSSFIIEYLKEKCGIDLDSHLSDEQRALTTAYQRLLEDSLMPGIAYFRWVDAEGWPRFRDRVFRGIPWPLSKIIPAMLHRKQKRRLWDQGVGRHSRQEIFSIMRRDLQSISHALSSEQYFWNNQVSTLDCIAFGIVGNLMTEDCVGEFIDMRNEFPKLVKYIQQLKSQYFPDIEQ